MAATAIAVAAATPGQAGHGFDHLAVGRLADFGDFDNYFGIVILARVRR